MVTAPLCGYDLAGNRQMREIRLKLDPMTSMHSSSNPQMGALIKEWRAQKGVSQFQLAQATGLSQRHISFIETGKARASRPTVLALCRSLKLSAEQRDQLLVKAGFLPQGYVHADFALSPVDIQALTQHLPQGLMAAIVNDAWDLLAGTASFHMLLNEITQAPTTDQGPINLLKLFMAPSKLCPRIHEAESLGQLMVQQLIQHHARAPTQTRMAQLLSELKEAIAMLAETIREEGPGRLPPFFQIQIDAAAGARKELRIVMTTIGSDQVATHHSPCRLLLIDQKS